VTGSVTLSAIEDNEMIRRVAVIAALLLAFQLCAFASSRSGRDLAQFGSNIEVPEGEQVGDVACFGCSVRVRGTAGDVAVFGGSVYVTGTANDVAVFGGNANVEGGVVHDTAIIGGRLRVTGDGVVRGERAVFPPVVLLVPLIVLGLMIWALVVLLRWLFGGRRQRRVIYVPAPKT
jgi:hypothetical protein